MVCRSLAHPHNDLGAIVQDEDIVRDEHRALEAPGRHLGRLQLARRIAHLEQLQNTTAAARGRCRCIVDRRRDRPTPTESRPELCGLVALRDRKDPRLATSLVVLDRDRHVQTLGAFLLVRGSAIPLVNLEPEIEDEDVTCVER